MARLVDTNRTPKKPSTSSNFASKTIVIDDDQDVPACKGVASLQYELSLINEAIDLARKTQQKAQARRDQEQLALIEQQLALNKDHAAERKRETERLESLLEDQKELQARFSHSLQSDDVRSKSNGSFSSNSATRVKLESGLTGSSKLIAGTQIATPESSQTPLPLRQSLSSLELEETPGRHATDNKAKGQLNDPARHNKLASGSPAHSGSHNVGRSAQSETAKLLEAFGAQYGSSISSSSLQRRARDKPAVNRSSNAKVKVEDHESDGTFEIIQLSDEDESPSAARNRLGSNSPSGSRKEISAVTASNGVQYTRPARNIKRERVEEEELIVTPSPKRTQRHVRGSTAADGRRIKMEDGELVCWPVRMPPYIRQLTDFSLKQQFPETNYKFSRLFLTMCLGGNPCETRPKVGRERRENQIYDVDEYNCWSPDWNPHIPPKRGVHGACLSIDIWDGNSERPHRRQRVTLEDGSEALNEDLQLPRHTFCKRRDLEFEYVGRYAQGRFFERLTNEEYDMEVPEKTRAKWAENIVVKEWGARMLIEGGVVRTKEEAKNMSPAAIRRLMDRPDDHPGKKLRFYWRYLEFFDYDKNFYEALAAKGREVGYTTKPDKAPYQFGHPTRFELEDAADSVMFTEADISSGPSTAHSSRDNERSDINMAEREDELKEEPEQIMHDFRSLYEDSD